MGRPCRLCGEDKPEAEFALRGRGQRRSDCKPCRASVEAARRYDTTVGEVQALAEKQGHCCAICGTHKSQISHASFSHNPLVIGHCHSTGQVRGLLCPTCNVLLGHAKDNVALLASAIAYLSS